MTPDELINEYKKRLYNEGWKYWQVADDLCRRVDCGLTTVEDSQKVYAALLQHSGVYQHV